MLNLFKFIKRNPCKECVYYHPNNNTCQSKKVATMGYGYVTLIERMLCEPFAERHGRWINGKCSVCEADAPYTYDGFWEETPYCFNCGSRMDLEDDEDK